MKVAPLYEVKEKLSQLVRELNEEPLLITRNGKPCAALIPVSEDDLEAFLLAHHPRFMTLIDRSHAHAKKHGGVSFSAVAARVKARKK